jgi:hypothetical protein
MPEQTAIDRIGVASGVIALHVDRGYRIPVELEILDCEPDDRSTDNWDHIAESSIEFQSGLLILADWLQHTPPPERIPIPAGCYRCRAYFGGLGTTRTLLEGDDHYRIVLWPGAPIEPKVLKRYVYEPNRTVKARGKYKRSDANANS